MESNQVHVLAAAVSRDLQQIVDTIEAGFLREIKRHIFDRDRRNRINDDVTVLHLIAIADLHARARPDANAASDAATPDAFAESFGKNHRSSPVSERRPRRARLPDLSSMNVHRKCSLSGSREQSNSRLRESRPRTQRKQ